jgi:HD domain
MWRLPWVSPAWAVDVIHADSYQKRQTGLTELGAPSALDLPRVVLATTVVVVVPVVAALLLRVYGVVSSPWLSMVLAGGLSLAASCAGAWCWRRRRGGGALLFSDLLIWGWLRRWRQDRKLAAAIKALDLDHPGGAGAAQWGSVARAERVLSQLVNALEGQDVYLRGHSRRVARHAGMIAQGMRLPAEEIDRVRAAAVVHDVGKLRTPRQIVNKPGRLTDAEFELIKLHPLVGAEMTAALADPGLTAIVRHHHERIDGTGYPDGLRGNQIPLGARIIAVADTFDAVTSTRPYRGATRHQRAIEILRQASGSQLDAAAVRAFLAYYSGHRLTVAWATACATPRRIIGLLNGEAVAAPVSSGKLAAAVVISAAVAGSAAVAPTGRVNASRQPTAAPGISAVPGDSTIGPRAPLGTPPGGGKHAGSPSPARRPAAAFASASPTAQPRVVLIGNPAARQATNPAGKSPTGGPGTTSALSAPKTSVVGAPPTPAPSGTAPTSVGAPPTPTPTDTTAPSSQASSTANTPIAQTPVTTAPPSRPSHPQPRGHGGPGSASPSGNAYGQANGRPGNPNARGNPGDQGNQGGQDGGGGNSGGQGNATGPANASGHGNEATQQSPGVQGKAYGHTHAGS